MVQFEQILFLNTLLGYPPRKLTPTSLALQNRIACVQSLSGTGSLRVGADFIAKFLKGTKVYLSNPTWGNHKNIFTDAGVEWKWYRCNSSSVHRNVCVSAIQASYKGHYMAYCC